MFVGYLDSVLIVGRLGYFAFIDLGFRESTFTKSLIGAGLDSKDGVGLII